MSTDVLYPPVTVSVR